MPSTQNRHDAERPRTRGGYSGHDQIEGSPVTDRKTGAAERRHAQIDIRAVDADSQDFAALITEFGAELAERYPQFGLAGVSPVQDAAVVLVAYEGELPVGCGVLRELEPGVGEIKRMFVIPAARRHGIARLILEELESQAFEHAYSTLRLGSGVRQPEALRLYESCGYGRIEPFGEYKGGTLGVSYEKALDIPYDEEDISEALAPIESLGRKSQKAMGRLAAGTWQHTMLSKNVHALSIASALMSGRTAEVTDVTRDELDEALDAIRSMIRRTRDTKAKFTAGTSQHSLQRNRLKALQIAEALVRAEATRR